MASLKHNALPHTHAHDTGFTLVELIVVVAIISILSTVGYATYHGMLNRARDAIKRSDVNNIAKAFEVKFAGNSYGDDLTPANNASLFASPRFPTPPEGGNYTIVQDTETSGFTICAPLGSTPPCSFPSETCFCKSSSQAVPPIIGAENTVYVTNGDLQSQAGPSAESSPGIWGELTDYSGNGLDNRFAVAGWIGTALDIYYYVWEDFTYANRLPPDQPAQAPNHKFAWMAGKLDGRPDGLSCTNSPLCTQANIDNVYNAEKPKIETLLNKNVNKNGVWIVGNEANNYPYLAPDLYAYQFKKYYSLIKRLDPAAKIAHSGLLYFSNVFDNTAYDPATYLNNFLNALSSSGVKPDIYNVHFYPGYTLDQTSFNRNVQQATYFKNYVNSKDPGKPIWVTEFGVNTSTSNETVAAYMDTMLQYLYNEPQYKRWFWFAGTSADWSIPEWYATSLTKNGQLTTVGQHYKNWLTEGRAIPVPTSTPAPNILTNGNFENQLDGWGCSGAVSGSCSIDGSIKYAGSYSAKIVNTGGWWGWQIAQGNISATGGDNFCVSAQLKKQNSSDGVTISLQEGGGSWREQDIQTAATTDWQPVKGTVTVGSNWVTPVQVFLRAWNTGNTAWFDEVSLTRGPC